MSSTAASACECAADLCFFFFEHSDTKDELWPVTCSVTKLCLVSLKKLWEQNQKSPNSGRLKMDIKRQIKEKISVLQHTLSYWGIYWNKLLRLYNKRILIYISFFKNWRFICFSDMNSCHTKKTLKMWVALPILSARGQHRLEYPYITCTGSCSECMRRCKPAFYFLTNYYRHFIQTDTKEMHLTVMYLYHFCLICFYLDNFNLPNVASNRCLSPSSRKKNCLVKNEHLSLPISPFSPSSTLNWPVKLQIYSSNTCVWQQKWCPCV